MTREEYIDANLTLQLLGALAEEHGGLTGYSNETSGAVRLTLRFADGTAYLYAEDGGAVTLTDITQQEKETE